MRAEVLSWCRGEGLFAAGERVACAVSGGADSMAMLWCLRSVQSELGITVCAAHFNHRLRGAESDRDERFVREFCAAHDIPLTVGTADVSDYAKQTGASIETAAREKRYAFLEGLPCEKIATAHNADDNAETVLSHLLRGSGLRGLCGIPPKRGRVVRPLLSVTREQIEAYLRAEGIAWVEDSTNDLPNCLRNRLRHQVMPLLRAESPRLAAHLTAQSALIRADDAMLDDLAVRLLDSARIEPATQPPYLAALLAGEDASLDAGGSPCFWSCEVLHSAPDALQKRALRCLLRTYLPQDVALTHITALQSLLSAPSPSARISLPGGLTARRSYDSFTITREKPASFAPAVLKIPGETCLPELGLRFFCEMEEKFKKFANTPFHFAVKYDMIAQSIISVRPRRSGDVLLLRGGHRKTLKKLLIDRKIPRAERERIPVIATETAVLAVAGVGVDAKYEPGAGETALIIHIEKEEM